MKAKNNLDSLFQVRLKIIESFQKSLKEKLKKKKEKEKMKKEKKE